MTKSLNKKQSCLECGNMTLDPSRICDDCLTNYMVEAEDLESYAKECPGCGDMVFVLYPNPTGAEPSHICHYCAQAYVVS